MRFGEVPLAEAEGAILAHSLRLGAHALKKGRVLSAADIAALAAAGVGEVVAARLDPGDIREDEAAARIAASVAGENVTVVDDSTMPGGFGTSPFDDEGVPTQRTIVIERGILKAYLLNTYTAL